MLGSAPRTEAKDHQPAPSGCLEAACLASWHQASGSSASAEAGLAALLGLPLLSAAVPSS